MNRTELDKRNTAAITHWWVTMRDTGKVAPGLLDDLARIADEHAATPALVAADAKVTGGGSIHLGGGSTTEVTVTPGEVFSHTVGDATSSARTRTRTRGGPK